jgi:NAD(P)H-hydrate epimerase
VSAVEGAEIGGQFRPAFAASVYVFTREQMRELDRRAVDDFAMSTLVLMENAARGAAEAILDGLDGLDDARALIVAGPGNNGGDGLAIARHLHNAGVEVRIVLVRGVRDGGDRTLAPDAATNLLIAQRMGLPILTDLADINNTSETPIDVVIDALLGTGVAGERPIEPMFAQAIACINALRGKGSSVVAIDVPSGFDCSSGLAVADAAGNPACVIADATVTMAGLKVGMLSLDAQAFLGEVVVVDIGVPIELIRELSTPMDPN